MLDSDRSTMTLSTLFTEPMSKVPPQSLLLAAVPSRTSTSSSKTTTSTLVNGRSASISSTVYSSRSSRDFSIPLFGKWDGTLSELCDIVESDDSLCEARIVELQCRKQIIGVILHRFLLIRLEVSKGTEAFLRLDRRADPTVGIGALIRRGGATDANDCAMLARNANVLLKGPNSSAEATYPFRHQSPLLKGLLPFLRICSEELVRYCIWPDNCWFFCSLITSFLADQCPEDLNVKLLQNQSLAKHVRRRIRIRYHISSGLPLEDLTYEDQLEFVLAAAKGEAIGSKQSAQQLIKLEHAVSTSDPHRKRGVAPMFLTPIKFLRGLRFKRQWLTVSLSEVLYDVRRHPTKAAIFQDVSKRFRDEAAMRGLAPIAGSLATTELADLGWKLVKYRLYLPPKDAALLMKSTERLARQLLEKEPSMYHHGLLHETLTAYGEELGGEAAVVTGEPRYKKRDVFGDAVKMARLLNAAEPGAHLDSLADSLGSYCLALAELGEYAAASEACRESIEMWRELYTEQIAGRCELGDTSTDGGATHWQQVFRDFCWCFCTDDEACDAISEVMNLADSILTDTNPVEAADWPIMHERYGTFLKAAAAAPEGCKTLRAQAPR